MIVDEYLLRQIPKLIGYLSNIIPKNRAKAKLIISELKNNLRQFENASKLGLGKNKLIGLLSNEEIINARRDGLIFSMIKLGEIKVNHIKDKRNFRYKGKDCEWLFISISDKIDELRKLNSQKSLDSIKAKNINLQFSNLFYKMKLLTEFIK